VIAVLVGAFFAFGGQRYLSLEQLRAQQDAAQGYFVSHPWRTALGYFLVYVAVTGLSLPGAAVLTLFGGAVFGLWWGTLIVSFASSLGATLAFLASRFVLRDWVQGRFGERLKPINDGVAREGAFYLFALRLVPAFPFFVINLVMGLTPLRTWTFYWVSQLGMLAGTVVYVYAGAQLAEFRLSGGLIVAFTALGLFPLVAKKVLDALKARRVYARWAEQKPRQFDRNMVVIGAGSSGLVSALIAAAVKSKVTLVEKHKMGGDCLNTGCVPSTALIKTARVLSTIRRAKEYGLKNANAEFDFAEVMERVQRVIRTIEPHDSVERFESLGVECVQGEAKIASPWIVEIKCNDGSTKVLTTRSIVIATGARPRVPPRPGLEHTGDNTTHPNREQRELAPRRGVGGGGPLGSPQ
jgi:uncharacterized membrane protein YdjX (TVP38/TMEM64 family)/thioredoxin reductase